MDTDWPGDWLRGLLETTTLAIVAEGETYGYLVAARLADAGLGTVKGGTLYPLLNRLEAAGALASEWRQGDGGPGRKFYAITPTGRAQLDRQRRQWQTFSDRISVFLGAERTTT
jgi:PadR family transcriptional regulator PadR